MSRLHLSRIAVLAAFAVSAGVPAVTAVAAPAGAATTTYTITDLGSLGGGSAEATAINALGQVTGESTLARQVQVPCPYPQSPNQKCFVNPDHAFFWSNGTMTDLGSLGGLNSEGVAINDSGEVVGWSSTKTPTVSPFLANPAGRKLTVLSAPGQALGINDSGQIAGECIVPNAGEAFACVVSSTGTITQLGQAVPGETAIGCGRAVAINNNGQALAACIGEGLLAPFQGDAAVLWTNGTPTVAGPVTDSTVPIGLNNNGQVVGIIETTSTGGEAGWSWSNGTTTDLSFLPAAINDSGVIVGGPFVDSAGTVQDLSTLIPAGFRFFSATGINDNGQIVGNAMDTATGQIHALLLTPS